MVTKRIKTSHEPWVGPSVLSIEMQKPASHQQVLSTNSLKWILLPRQGSRRGLEEPWKIILTSRKGWMTDTRFSLPFLGSNQITYHAGRHCKLDGCFPFIFFSFYNCISKEIIGWCRCYLKIVILVEILHSSEELDGLGRAILGDSCYIRMKGGKGKKGMDLQLMVKTMEKHSRAGHCHSSVRSNSSISFPFWNIGHSWSGVF